MCVCTVMSFFQFSASAGMSQSSQHTETTESVVTASRKTCLYGQVRLMDYFATPSLTIEFVYTVRDLPSEYDEDAYLEFIDDWGTVSCYKITYGYEYAFKK